MDTHKAKSAGALTQKTQKTRKPKKQIAATREVNFGRKTLVSLGLGLVLSLSPVMAGAGEKQQADPTSNGGKQTVQEHFITRHAKIAWQEVKSGSRLAEHKTQHAYHVVKTNFKTGVVEASADVKDLWNKIW